MPIADAWHVNVLFCLSLRIGKTLAKAQNPRADRTRWSRAGVRAPVEAVAASVPVPGFAAGAAEPGLFLVLHLARLHCVNRLARDERWDGVLMFF
jgi:hypothetical protein